MLGPWLKYLTELSIIIFVGFMFENGAIRAVFLVRVRPLVSRIINIVNSELLRPDDSDSHSN